jgi:hypothetical protein
MALMQYSYAHDGIKKSKSNPALSDSYTLFFSSISITESNGYSLNGIDILGMSVVPIMT